MVRFPVHHHHRVFSTRAVFLVLASPGLLALMPANRSATTAHHDDSSWVSDDSSSPLSALAPPEVLTEHAPEAGPPPLPASGNSTTETLSPEARERLMLSTTEDADPPADSLALDEARQRVGAHFQRTETRRFVVLSDASEQWTRDQAACLERAYHQFQRAARQLNLEPQPLRHKLVCVLFERRTAFQSFAREHDAVADVSIAGYYSPRTDRIVFYNPRSNPSVGRANDELSDLERRIAQLQDEARVAEREGDRDRANQLRAQAEAQQGHLASESAKIGSFVEGVSVATTVHEAIHQLMFHTGLQSASIQYPLWISEGIATSFETSDANSAFGPVHEYQPRREAFDRLLREDRLLPLETLIVLTMLPARNEDEAHVVYQQSYALVKWLSRHRRVELGRYLDLLRREPPGRPTSLRHAALFSEAFGDVETLERTWLRAERSRMALHPSAPGD